MGIKLELYRQKERLKRRIHRGRFGYCTVLLYHRIIDLKYDPQLLCVSPENFEKQLTELKKNSVFLNIEEFCEILNKGKRFPENSFLITFDDGYADNLHYALPILEVLNLPAVFYVSTAGIDTDRLMWWDELDLIFKKQKENATDISALIRKYNFKTSEELYHYYLNKCKTAASLSERNILMDEVRTISEVLPNEKENYRTLSMEELKKLSASKMVTVGGHTINHLSLGHLSAADKRTEIDGSVKWLEENLGLKINHFSYPYGEKSNYDETTISLCRQKKLHSAAANYEGYVSAGADLFSFPRFVVRNDTPEVLLKKLKRVLV